jgi:hypothetical protein
MKNVFKAVIEKGGYDLTGILKKIDTYHIEGKLSDAEKEELYALARKEPQAQYDFSEEIEKLWVAVRELQRAEKDDESFESVSDWKQPSGGHDSYMVGDIVKYTDGRIYKSLIDNNVWSPETYPNGWEVIE